MAKIRFFISYFLILSLTVIFVWGACGGGDSDSDGDDVVIVECDGATSGSFADDGGQFELTIPDSGVSDCLYISPNVTSSSDTTDLVGENETLLSGSAFELSLNTEGDNDAEASPDEDLLITIAFDESLVPDAGDVDALHIYANVAFEDEDGNEVVVPVFGDVDDGELIINTKGLYNVTRWVVVYNPDMGSDIDTTEPTVYLTDASQLTDEPGYSGGWNQNDWCAMYDASDAVLRQTIATALSKAVGELTGADISTYIKTNVSLAAKIAGLTYADGGFREPNLYPYEPSSSPSQVNICSDATRDYYKVIIAGSSHYQNPSTVKGKNPFGILYLGSSEVNDAITGAAGSTFDAIAHEMFHAIFAGYDLSFLRRGLGMNEGMASTLGHTLGWADYFDRVSINSTDWD
ncbi:MAG TPA: hypothetical protein VJC18_05145, partial [bacterium]|nr:hypothetical protein [bacterium]